MGVWDHLENPEELVRLLQHPAHDGVTSTIARLIRELRAGADVSALRKVQEDLATALVTAEAAFQRQSRLTKLGTGDPLELTFWRRACVQLRTVGDAVAWRFVGFRRQWLAFMARNQRPGIMSDKKGFEDEWNFFEQHWEDGEPTVFAGLTNCVRLGDLLVARGEELWTIEVKRSSTHFRASQTARLRELKRQINEDHRIEGPNGPSWILESDVPLVSHWTNAEPHVRRAEEQGVAVWVPEPGVAVGITSSRAAVVRGLVEWQRTLETEREAARVNVGQGTHKILIHGVKYPYLARLGAPLSVLPLDPDLVARIVTGELLFTTELHVEAMAAALQEQGAQVANLLADLPDGAPLPQELLRWRRRSAWGVVRQLALEQLGIELTKLSVWASANVNAPRPPGANGSWRGYLCFAREADVWA